MWRRSIRARMTFSLVLALLPLCMMVGAIGTAASMRGAETMDTQMLQLTADRVARRVADGRRVSITHFLRSDPDLRAHRIGVLVLDPAGRILFRAGDVPRWRWQSLVRNPVHLKTLLRGSDAGYPGPPWGYRYHFISSPDQAISDAPATGPPGEWRPPAVGPPLIGTKTTERAAPPRPGFKSEEPRIGAPGPASGFEPDAALQSGLLHWRVAAVRLGDGGLVVASMRRDDFSNNRGRPFDALVAMSLILLAVAAGAWHLVGCVLSPIRRLADQADTATSRDLNVRLEAPSRDAEVVHLVGTLNGLLARLAQNAAIRGRFYAAASHELRTPLQALSGHLEVALARDRSAEEYRETVSEAYRQTQRLIRLTTDLLLLNRLDSALPDQKEELDLTDVVETVVQQHNQDIRHQALHLETNLTPLVRLVAPPTHLEILVRNLVENAVKYTEPRGRLRIFLAAGSIPRLEVINQAAWDPGMDGERLSEPFYRPDPSRNSCTGGNGLGLAICRAIAQANGWRLVLDRVTEGVRATVEFSPARKE